MSLLLAGRLVLSARVSEKRRQACDGPQPLVCDLIPQPVPLTLIGPSMNRRLNPQLMA
jgi:hypothetical protein